MSWQPIETAPKDTPVLVWVPAFEATPAGAHRAVFTAGTWWLVGLGIMHEFGSRVMPTHWMPIPDPPDPPAFTPE